MKFPYPNNYKMSHREPCCVISKSHSLVSLLDHAWLKRFLYFGVLKLKIYRHTWWPNTVDSSRTVHIRRSRKRRGNIDRGRSLGRGAWDHGRRIEISRAGHRLRWRKLRINDGCVCIHGDRWGRRFVVRSGGMPRSYSTDFGDFVHVKLQKGLKWR